MAATLTLILIALAVAGTPIFVIILAAAMLGFYFSEVDLSVITIELYRITDTPLLIALPFFTLAGYLLAESKSSERLVRVK